MIDSAAYWRWIAGSGAGPSLIGTLTDLPCAVDLDPDAPGEGRSIALGQAGSGLASAGASVSDAENDAGGWSGGSLLVQRVDAGGLADGCRHDVYRFIANALFRADGDAISEGVDGSGTLRALADGQRFADWEYDSASGALSIRFSASASTGLVQAVVRGIGYANESPYGDATIRFELDDGVTTTRADVLVRSATIHVDQTATDTDGDAADGFSLHEALALAVDGDRILLHDGAYRGQFLVTQALTIDAFRGVNGRVVLEAPDREELAFSGQTTINGRQRMPVLDIRQADPSAGVTTVRNLMIDGRYQAPLSSDGHANGTEDLIGIAVFDSDAVIEQVRISHIATAIGVNGDYSGFSENFGILVEGSGALDRPATVTIRRSAIDTFQKTGILAWGPMLDIRVLDNAITGVGIHGISNQNGMQIGSSGARAGTTGLISGNVIDGLDTISPVYSATAILLRMTGGMEVAGNTVSVLRGPDQNQTVGVDLLEASSPVHVHDNRFIGLNTAIYLESPYGTLYSAAHRLENNAYPSVWYAVVDDVVDGAVNPLEITVDSAARVDNGRGFLEYQLNDGDDRFNDAGLAPSLVDGGAGDDTLASGGGDDTLTGGPGDDLLTGGGGADRFGFEGLDDGLDRIVDFGPGDAIRVLGRSDAGGVVAEGGAADVPANSVHLNVGDGFTDLFIDADGGAGAAEVSLRLSGDFSADNFRLQGELIRYRSVVFVRDIALAEDTGVSDQDRITASPAQRIVATLSAPLRVGESLFGSLDGGLSWVRLSDPREPDGLLVRWTGASLNEGGQILLQVRDAADIGGPLARFEYLLDTVAPLTALADLDILDDTGPSDNDFITRVAVQTITATLDAPLDGGESLHASLDGGRTWVDISDRVSGTQLDWGPVLLAGTSEILIEVRDTAGNAGPRLTRDYSVLPPVLSTGIAGVQLSADTGASDRDFVTAVAAQTITAILGQPLGPEQTLVGSLDGGINWQALDAMIVDTALSWEGVTLSGAGLLCFEVRDAGGNAGPITAQRYLLDTTAPLAAASTLALLPDTGVRDSDFRTAEPEPVIQGQALLGAGERVEVSVDGGVHWATAATGAAVDGGGFSWSIGSLAIDSDIPVLIRVVDLAGNPGPMLSQPVVIDTLAPGLTLAPGVIAVGDAVTITSILEEALVYLIPDGQSVDGFAALRAMEGLGLARSALVMSAPGALTLPSAGLPGGRYRAVAVDLAGNIGPVSETAVVLNHPPGGVLRIEGGSSTGATLRAVSTVTDPDGIVDAHYQWFANGVPLPGATGAEWVADAALVGQRIHLELRYVDGIGCAQTVTSVATEAIALANAAPRLSLTGLLGDDRIAEDVSTLLPIAVARVAVTDDGVGSAVLTLSGPDASQFELSGSLLSLRAGVRLDFEQRSLLTVDLSVRDPSLPPDTTSAAHLEIALVNVVDGAPSPAPLVLPPRDQWSGLPDADDDGIAAALERLVPALDVAGAVAGDGNGDGIADALQRQVASSPFQRTATAVSDPTDAPFTFVTLVAAGAAGDPAQPRIRALTQDDAPTDLPAALTMPLGLIACEALGTPGADLHLSLYVDADLPVDGYWKRDQDGFRVNLASEPWGGALVVDGGKIRLDFVIRDGGPFDDDHRADGVVTSQGGVGDIGLSLVAYRPDLPFGDGWIWF